SYDYALTCMFADLAAHNAYQVHPLHTAFVAVGKPLWSRVQIYDAE
ncbi:MAG: Dabb family protein, partial [Opitutaceae bacterium]|nr:Dabb family protein [Opitutaceae bacterium]